MYKFSISKHFLRGDYIIRREQYLYLSNTRKIKSKRTVADKILQKFYRQKQ